MRRRCSAVVESSTNVLTRKTGVSMAPRRLQAIVPARPVNGPGSCVEPGTRHPIPGPEHSPGAVNGPRWSLSRSTPDSRREKMRNEAARHSCCDCGLTQSPLDRVGGRSMIRGVLRGAFGLVIQANQGDGHDFGSAERGDLVADCVGGVAGSVGRRMLLKRQVRPNRARNRSFLRTSTAAAEGTGEADSASSRAAREGLPGREDRGGTEREAAGLLRRRGKRFFAAAVPRGFAMIRKHAAEPGGGRALDLGDSKR